MTKQEFLAMSLPYGLKMLQSCEHWFIPEPNRVVLLTGIADVDGKAPMQYGNEPTETTIFYRLNKDITGTDYVLRFKPILRPLSDLTKEIEYKGEKFNPSYKLGLETISGIEFYKSSNSDLEINIETPNYSTQIDLYSGFLIVQKLIEWHFDIADLISKGEAIDVNTLEVNPYK